MKKRLINSQLTNWFTYQLYLRKMLTLAENVFIFENMPSYIDIGYINSNLVRKGAVAFFYEDVLETVVALPFNTSGINDIYGRPRQIEVFGQNGYRRTLKQDEFVIMYDNTNKISLYMDIQQSAERMALIKRTIDINIAQQKTPRIWTTTQDKEKSLRDLLNNVDSYEESILTYKDINLKDTDCILQPAPYIADKLDLHKENEWSEFLQLIGITNLAIQKKERNISDEINAILGGTIASRFSRYEPRRKAVEEINKKFNLNIELKYYDGTPATDEKEENIEIKEGEDNVL